MSSAVPKRKTKKISYINGSNDHGHTDPISEANDSIFLNKDISWIHFNARVISQAADREVPLLERLKFLSIATNNFDEFFMKRVGSLKNIYLDQGGSNYNLKKQLQAIREALLPHLNEQARIFSEELKPELAKAGIQFVHFDQLTAEESAYCRDFFTENVFPLLTPLSVDAGHPFPFLSNLSTSIGFCLKHPKSDELLFARVKLPESVPKKLRLPSEDVQKARFVSLAELIQKYAGQIFPGMLIESSMLFRVTRNGDFEIDEDEAEDLLEVVENHLKERRSGQIIRLEHGSKPDQWILNFLVEELQLQPDEVYGLNSEIDFKDFEPVYELNIPSLKYPRLVQTLPVLFTEEASIFHAIKSQDVLVHHPFESFAGSVERFVKEASEDPKVLAIKMTVYRVGHVTPLIPYLINAAEQGKHVVCLVELKARFDEKQNIHWANTLEKAGVHVVYGIPGVKTHAKTILVIRQDSDAVRAYAHCGTGNYHARTANHYTDLGLFTSRPEVTRDLIHFFNFLTGRSIMEDYKNLLVAPVNMEQKFLTCIQSEIDSKRNGGPGHIIAKMNSLEDRHVIEALYEASKAGVKVDLIVRGICSLRPGVPGLSENIRVISLVGRFLEHSRLFYFSCGKEDPLEGSFYIGSADWMNRNLHRRIEVAIPIIQRSLRERCMQIFYVMLSDRRQTWELKEDGSYFRLKPHDIGQSAGAHETLMNLTAQLNNLELSRFLQNSNRPPSS